MNLQTMKTFYEYRLRFYLNAQHFVIFDGRKGPLHPHTWEVSVTIRFPRNELRLFSTYEQRLINVLEPYQNKVLNDIPPFNALNPTLENITEHLGEQYIKALRKCGGELRKIEISESLARTYIVDIADEENTLPEIQSEEYLYNLADDVLDILQ